jgi:hypothetical protein
MHFKIKNEVKKFKYCDFSGCESCKKVKKKRFISSKIYAESPICSICEDIIKSRNEPANFDEFPILEVYDENDD